MGPGSSLAILSQTLHFLNYFGLLCPYIGLYLCILGLIIPLFKDLPISGLAILYSRFGLIMFC